jgi:uncharacterized membrane protein YkvA (DUF1232 family)
VVVDGVMIWKHLMLQQLKEWARNLKRDIVALYIAARDPRTPLPAKCVSIAVVTYALSPIDLIPDFIPILGYLDDIILLPLGIIWAVRLIPQDLMQSFRENAIALTQLKKSWIAAGVIMAVWVMAALSFAIWLY